MSSMVAKTAHVAQAQKKSTQNPLLCLLYRARSRAIHGMVRKIQRETAETGEGGAATQLLLLGAGLDVSFQQAGGGAPAPGHGTAVFAVDLPSVIREREEAAAHVAPSVDMAFDLSTVAESHLQLTEALSSRGFNWSAPTIVVTEMVLGYLPEAAVRSLLLFLSSSLARAFIVSYDVALDASSGYSQTLLKEFDKRGAPLRCCHPTHAAHWLMFRDCGWARGATCSMLRAASELLFEVHTQEAEFDHDDMVFDEHAALFLLQSRYCLTVACAGAYLVPDAETEALVQRIVPNAVEHLFPFTASASCSSSTPTYSLRPALCADGPVITSLYLQCMQQYADKYPSVAKFGRTVVKQLANLGKYFGCEEGRRGKSEGGLEEEKEGRVKQKSKARFWVVCVESEEGGDEVVGCVGLRVGKSSVAEAVSTPDHQRLGLIGEVQHMCVSAMHRRRGLASMLLSALDSHARDLGCHGLELSVLTDLAAARRLYELRGFVGGAVADCGAGCRIEHMVLKMT